MDKEYIINLLQKLKNGNLTTDECYGHLKDLPFKKMKNACIDNWRGVRRGFPEVVYCANKTYEQIEEILSELLKNNSKVLLTRLEGEMAEKLLSKFEDGSYNTAAKILSFGKAPETSDCRVSIITAGTSDIPVAEEAVETLKIMGIPHSKYYDIGVAGLHRLIDKVEEISKSTVAIVIAGMEGALPSVVGGLVDTPVIAVPTSVGYGVNFKGLTALMAMLNSCSSGVTVVNIDNGFGAAFSAALICKKKLKKE